MLNTCSIGRRWKSREGWSRPVLTGERGTLFPTLVGRVSSCGGFLVGWQGTLFLVVTTTILVRRLICLRPLSGSRTATTGIVVGSVAGRRFSGRPYRIGFAVVMAQVRRPVPFRTRKLRPGTAMVLHSRGCGRVARRRIQLSGPSGRVPWGIPGRSLFLFSWGFPPGATPRKPPFFVCCAGQPAGARCPRFPRRAFPVARRPDYSTHRETLERRGISGISGEPLALIRWLNRLKNYALFRTQTLCRIEQNHVSRQSNSPAGRRPKLA